MFCVSFPFNSGNFFRRAASFHYSNDQCIPPLTALITVRADTIYTWSKLTYIILKTFFHTQLFSKQQPFYNFLCASFRDLLDISECHYTLMLYFYDVLYTPTLILGHALENLTTETKGLARNSYLFERKLELFFRHVPFLAVELRVSCLFLS